MTNSSSRKLAAKAKQRTEALKLQQQREQRKIKHAILHQEYRQIRTEGRELCDYWATWSGAKGSYKPLGYKAAKDVIRNKIKAEKVKAAAEAQLDVAEEEADHMLDHEDDSSEDDDDDTDDTDDDDTDTEMKVEQDPDTDVAIKLEKDLGYDINETADADVKVKIEKDLEDGGIANNEISVHVKVEEDSDHTVPGQAAQVHGSPDFEWPALPKVRGKVDAVKFSREMRTYFQKLEDIVNAGGAGSTTVEIPQSEIAGIAQGTRKFLDCLLTAIDA